MSRSPNSVSLRRMLTTRCVATMMHWRRRLMRNGSDKPWARFGGQLQGRSTVGGNSHTKLPPDRPQIDRRWSPQHRPKRDPPNGLQIDRRLTLGSPWIGPRSTLSRPSIHPRSTPSRPRVDPRSTPCRPQIGPTLAPNQRRDRAQIALRSFRVESKWLPNRPQIGASSTKVKRCGDLTRCGDRMRACDSMGSRDMGGDPTGRGGDGRRRRSHGRRRIP